MKGGCSSGLTNVVAISAGFGDNMALKADGTVVVWGDNTYGQTNVPAGLSNVMAVAAGAYHCAALKNDGTVVCWGDDSQGQTNVPASLKNVKLLSASVYHTIAGVFSPPVQYPVDVTKDLLLIYNSNSTDSSNLCAYYLAHRPMVGGANVLGLACDVGEFTTSNNCDAQIVAPVLNWLTNNPTKRPQYVILFYDIPTRLTNSYPYPSYGSVSYHLHNLRSDWQPFVNNINAGSLTDCEAYVDKIARMATNSPGQLVISASAENYGDTNFVLDNIRHGTGYGHPPLTGDADYSAYGSTISNAIGSLTANGVAPGAIIYLDGLDVILTNTTPFTYISPSHITNALNVTGYICWGGHSNWGTTNLNDGNYALDGNVRWAGNSGWWIIETAESYNGQRQDQGQGTFIKWLSPNAFGGTNYSNTPIGAVTHVEEPTLPGIENSATYFGLWASGKNFAICAWSSRNTPYFQAVGDPLVTR